MGTAASEAYVLVVEDQPALARAIAGRVRPYVSARCAGSIVEAQECLQSGDLIAALILDVGLPDGSGLDLLEDVRERRPHLPTLVLTGRQEWEDVDRAFNLAARYARKSAEPGALTRSITSFIANALPGGGEARRVIEDFASRHGLSSRQTEILWLHVRGVEREKLAVELRLGENTVKSHVRELLRKCEAQTLDALCRRILQEALVLAT